jgi:hypothetical protein
MARAAVYNHNSLRVKRRSALENDTLAAIWFKCGLVCEVYRQWRLVGQRNTTPASITEQLSRRLRCLLMWERIMK